MENSFGPFIDTLKTISANILGQTSQRISDPRLKIRAEMWMQVMLAIELLSIETETQSQARLLGLELGCMMSSDLPNTKTGEYRADSSARARRSKWVDAVMVSSDWATWLWLELKALLPGSLKKYQEFVFYDIIGRKIGDVGLNEIDAESTIRLFDGDSGEVMRRNSNLLEWELFRTHYSEVRLHLKAGLLLWDDRNGEASSFLQKVNKYNLVYADLATHGSNRLSIIHPSQAT